MLEDDEGTNGRRNTEVDDRDDVRVVKPGDGQGFAPEAVDGRRRGFDVVSKDLDGDFPIERELNGSVDRAHASFAEKFLEAVLVVYAETAKHVDRSADSFQAERQCSTSAGAPDRGSNSRQERRWWICDKRESRTGSVLRVLQKRAKGSPEVKNRKTEENQWLVKRTLLEAVHT